MSRAITVRLDDEDHAALQTQAARLRIRPGTLARILVHTGLNGDATVAGSAPASAALARLVRRSQEHAPADAVGLISEARVALDRTR